MRFVAAHSCAMKLRMNGAPGCFSGCDSGGAEGDDGVDIGGSAGWEVAGEAGYG